MSQEGLGTVGECATTVATLIIFSLSTCLLNLAANAQEENTVAQREEPWSYLERMGFAYDERMGEAHDKKIYEAFASTALGARRVATVGKADGKFNINVWEVLYAGGWRGVVHRATYEDEAEPTAELEIATLRDQLEMDEAKYKAPDCTKTLKPFGHRFVTAARTVNKTLKLTVWDVTAEGNQITKRGSGETGEIHGEFAVATFSTYRVVTAVRDANDNLKLISWHIYPNGTLQRLESIPAAEKVDQIAIATYDSYPPNSLNLATAVTMKSTSGSGDLKIIAWTLDTAGRFTRLGDTTQSPVKDVAAATLSHRRIVTAVRNAQLELEVQTWDFDAEGKVSLHSGGKAGAIKTAPDVTTQGGARVITSVLDGEGHLTLITWDAIDDVVRLDHVRSESVNASSIVPLGADWLATPVQTQQNTLEVIAWREHGVSLLRGRWPPPGPIKWVTEWNYQGPEDGLSAEEIRSPQDERHIRQPQGERQKQIRGNAKIDKDIIDGLDTQSFQPSVPTSVKPRLASPDAMIAVGFNHFIVSNAGTIVFFDKKTMKRLDSKKGEPTRLPTTDFFATFITGKPALVLHNEHSINRHLALPPNPPHTYRPYHTCDPDNPKPTVPCINSFFDTRIYFHRTGPSTGRFFIAAEARAEPKAIDSSGAECDTCSKDPPSDGDPDCQNLNMPANQLNRRYFAFAVSKTEDPRDGFYQWMTTEPHILDWPILTVDGKILAISAGVDPKKLNVSPIGMKPQMYLFALEDLLYGRRYPKSHKLFIWKTAGGDVVDEHVVPFSHYGDTANRMFFVQARESGGVSTVNIYSFLHPSDWKNFPPLERTEVTLKFKLNNPMQGATFRNGKIYLASDADPEGEYSKQFIRVVRLPLTNLTTEPQASTNAADGYLYAKIGKHALNETVDVEYDNPSITANKDGNIVTVYRRKDPIKPEARYSIWFPGEQKPRRSNLLLKGDCNVGGGKLDFQTAVVDPADDQTVWMAAFFAADKDGDCGTTDDDRGDRMVVGKVKP